MKKILIAALLAAGMAGSVNAATVFSENFDSGTLGGFTTAVNVAAANGATYNPCCGTDPSYTNFFAAFDGGPPGAGTLSVDFNTVAGKIYTVAFDVGALGGGSEPLTVSAGATSTVYNPVANNNLNAAFSPVSFNFLGTGGATTLQFASAGTFGVDAIIDNVSISAVPEPTTWAMMIGGFGAIGGTLRQRNRKTTRRAALA